jgi:cytochrome P450
MASVPATDECPIAPNRDERKSAALAARNVTIEGGAKPIRSFAFAREILRSASAKQAGAGAEHVDVGNPEHVPVFYLDGEVHRKRRAAIVPFFTPKVIATRYRAVMERMTDELLARLQAKGQARLDEISFELAVAVAADIVGLTERKPLEMAPRIAAVLRSSFTNAGGLARFVNKIRMAWHGYRFYVNDVRPAVRARRIQRREDIISQTIDQGYSDRAIMIECMTYATAGMVTTREFIVMAAWYMFERPELRERFLAAAEAEQIAILMEILRLEPIAALVYRRVVEDIPSSSSGPVPAGAYLAVDLRAVNSDEAVVGPCPHMLDPDRARKQQQNGSYMSFGDGAHHCPGWQVAMHETRVFLDRLLRLPGIRLERDPDMLWNAMLSGYELRNAVVVCDRV